MPGIQTNVSTRHIAQAQSRWRFRDQLHIAQFGTATQRGSPAVVDILQKSAQKLWPWRPWKGCLNVETHFQMIGLTELSSTFSEIFYVEICRATISTMMSFPLSPKLSKASSPLMSLSSLQGKLQGPSFLWLGMVNAQGDAHRFDSCETQLSLAYLSIMCPSLYSDEPPGFS